MKVKNKFRWEILEDLIKEYKFEVIAELGAGEGHPALYLLEHCPTITEYIAIDPDPTMGCKIDNKHGEKFRKFPLEKFNSYNKGKYINETASRASGLYPDKYFDLVYVDHLVHVNNITKKDDLEIWTRKVKEGGIICGHDYDLVRGTHVTTVKMLDLFFPNLKLIPEEQNNIWWVQL